MSEATVRTYLKRLPFFKAFDDEYLEFLSQHATERELPAGSMIFHQGERANHFYIVLKGAVIVEVPALYGPALQIQRLGPDQVLGWSWLIAPYQWDFQAQAIEDSRVIEFDAAAILARCEKESQFGYELIKAFTVLMSERLRSARRKMMEQWMPSGFA